MKIGILLSGCGVYDGSEIQEAVLAMLAVKEAGHEYICISVDQPQHHVVNHLTGEEMPEQRNMMVESARIARGEVLAIGNVHPADLDAVILPGGFGAAKNFTKWAFEGPDATILPEVKLFLVNMSNVGKPICALCVSPVVVAKALEGSAIHQSLTLGTSAEQSPYDIQAFHDGLKKTGATYQERGIHELSIDTENRIISAPCYMLETDILAVRNNVKAAVVAMIEMCH